MIKIKELRVEKQFTQTELAKLLEVNQTAVGKYERGELEPNIQILKKLANIFDVTVDYLIGREDDFGIKTPLPNELNYTEKEKPLTLKEQRLLNAFTQLSDLEKEKLIEDAEFYARLHSKTEHTNPIK